MNARSIVLLLAFLFPGISPPVLAEPYVVLEENNLVLADGFLSVPGGQIIVRDGAVLSLSQPATLGAELLLIQAGGLVQGCGLIQAPVVNQGELVSNCGPEGDLELGGEVTNEATVRASHQSRLTATVGIFLNLGLLDLLTGAEQLPAQLENAGSIYTPSWMPETRIECGPANVILTLLTLAPHRYQLQGRADLAGGAWEDIGEPITGTGGVESFIHPGGGLAGGYFYRYTITD